MSRECRGNLRTPDRGTHPAKCLRLRKARATPCLDRGSWRSTKAMRTAAGNLHGVRRDLPQFDASLATVEHRKVDLVVCALRQPASSRCRRGGRSLRGGRGRCAEFALEVAQTLAAGDRNYVLNIKSTLLTQPTPRCSCATFSINRATRMIGTLEGPRQGSALPASDTRPRRTSGTTQCCHCASCSR